VIFALLASVWEAFFVLPAHLADFARPVMASKTHTKVKKSGNPFCFASSIPDSAKGRANIVCSNFISSKYSAIRFFSLEKYFCIFIGFIRIDISSIAKNRHVFNKVKLKIFQKSPIIKVYFMLKKI